MLTSLTTLFALFFSTVAAGLGDVDAADAELAAAVDDSALTSPGVISLRSEEGAVLLAGTAAVLDEQLSTTDRRRLGRKVLSASRVRITRGTFPSDAVAIVTVNVDLRRNDPAEPQRFIAGAFTLAEDGALVHMVAGPRTQTQRIDLIGIGDVDADGTDDLLFTDAEVDAAAQRLVTWPQGVLSDRPFVATSPE